MNDIKKLYYRIVSKGLIKLIYPLLNLFYEMFHSNYIVLTASVKPIAHNWGDDMSRQLCQLICPNRKFIVKKYTWNLFGKDDVLCIGSIISWMTTSKSVIWGSGVVYPNQKLPAIPQKVLAVRGPLTRKYLLSHGVCCPEVYGDPALLFPKYYRPSAGKKYKIGIIPHFRDKSLIKQLSFVEDSEVLVIDVQNIKPWTRFIDDICSCECIASSSLHGIIISDAYAIPNIWIEFEGGESKKFAFHDYLQSVHRDIDNPLLVTKTTTVAEIVEKCEPVKIEIDLDKLQSVCPFV